MATTDFDAWLASNGPKNMEEARALERVSKGAYLAGIYSGAASRSGLGWYIRRDNQTALDLSDSRRQKGFQQLVWYYLNGKLPWHVYPRNIDDFLNDSD